MLSYRLLGLFCLAALWATAALVAAAACGELRALRALLARLRPLASRACGTGLVEGEVIEGAGADGAFATNELTQVCHALDGPEPAVVARSRSRVSVVHGGIVRVGGEDLRVAGAPGAVWTAPARAPIPTDAGFDELYAAASMLRARGAVRSVVTTLGVGDHVFVAGEVAADGRLTPADGKLLVADADPRRAVRAKIRLVTMFVVGELLACGVCTALAVWPPAFGARSTFGAVLCLAFFLGVTPLGVRVRELSTAL